ncbi:hypothetical protein SAMN04487996_101111 [Dyadobacter soli]|uniref:Uncharacterized protein n=1 Tax=Dyadobacter soli TaxID=659014 RepID=A0A1G6V1M8_9BACT|nr:hypothetical protein SAMN04487996_101111 [Dyadobacter soli]
MESDTDSKNSLKKQKSHSQVRMTLFADRETSQSQYNDKEKSGKLKSYLAKTATA